MKDHMAGSILAAVVVLALTSAQTTSNGVSITGDFAGMVGSHNLSLHITASPDGKLRIWLGNADHLGTDGLQMTGVQFDGNTLTFTDAPDDSSWQGVSDERRSVVGRHMV